LRKIQSGPNHENQKKCSRAKQKRFREKCGVMRLSTPSISMRSPSFGKAAGNASLETRD
jgi:hypothetical protein